MREQPWIKVWGEKILSSTNLRELDFTANSVFLQLLLRVRPSGKYQGMLVYPNGKPLSDEALAKDMKLKPYLFAIAKKELLDRDILEQHQSTARDGKAYPVFYLRKFEDLSKRYRGEVVAENGEISQQLRNNAATTTPAVATANPAVTPINPDVTGKTNATTRTGIDAIDKEEEEEEEDIYTSIFTVWNSSGITTHKMLTPKIKRAINGKLNEGFTAQEIKDGITNYAKILKDRTTYFFDYRWTLELFLKRPNGLPQFVNWDTAHNNCKRNKPINQPVASKTGTHSRGAEYYSGVGK
ncbi:MAG: hypothetical protein QME51_08020 [Planctomycetota bacterium]|nr:hypothetical protein [Planctomycetota bacterium]